MKVCARCKTEKDSTHYGTRKQAGRTYLQSQCRQCMRESRKEWGEANVAQHISNVRKHNLKKKFDLTPEQYDDMLDAQAGVCAICETIPPGGIRLAVDHDHSTGKVRGLLCMPCNIGIGNLDDSIELLEAAINYLRR